MQGRFDSDTFTADVVEVAKKLVPLTVTLWNKVSIKMLPTPAKFHYLFNMRELSKVLQYLPACAVCLQEGLQVQQEIICYKRQGLAQWCAVCWVQQHPYPALSRCSAGPRGSH